jgi:4-hydroxybenzoate polyprenyltransferase
MKIYPKKKKMPAWLAIVLIFCVLMLFVLGGTIIGDMNVDRYNAELNMPATLILPTPCYTATARAAMTATVVGVPKPTPYGTKAVYCWEKRK